LAILAEKEKAHAELGGESMDFSQGSEIRATGLA
jgi:hypothetical protein